MTASFGVSPTQLTDAVAAEAAARTAADVALGTRVDDETAARIAAVAAEVSARQAADAAIDTRVDAIEAGGPVANLARFDASNPADTVISAVTGEPVLAGSGVQSDDIDEIVVLTQAAYDALGTPDPATLYVIQG